MATNIGQLVIKLQADVAELKTGLQQARDEARNTAKEISRSMREEARGSVTLLGEEIGVVIPRELRKVLAESSLVGPALSAAFSVVAAGAFLKVILELGPKIKAAAEEMGGFGEAAKKVWQEELRINLLQVKTEEERKQILRDIQLIGLDTVAAAKKQKEFSQADLDIARAKSQELAAQANTLRKTAQETRQFTNPKTGIVSMSEPTDAALAAQVALRAADDAANQAITDVRKLEASLSKAGATATQALSDQGAAAAAKFSAELEASRLSLKSLADAASRGGLDEFAAIEVETEQAMAKANEEFKKFPQNVLEYKEAQLQITLEHNRKIKEAEEKLAAEVQRTLVETGKVLQFPVKPAVTGATSPGFSGLGVTFDPAVLEKLRKEVEHLTPAFRSAMEAGVEFGRSIGQAFEQAVINGGKFVDILKAILVEIIHLIVEFTITKPLEAFFGTLFGGIFGGGRAIGGPVNPDRAYLVGESGPEMFVPQGSGSIVPNGRLGGQSIYIDARGADAGVELRVMRAIRASQEQSVNRAVSIVTERSRRTL